VASEAVKMRIIDDPNSFAFWGARAGNGPISHAAYRDAPRLIVWSWLTCSATSACVL